MLELSHFPSHNTETTEGLYKLLIACISELSGTRNYFTGLFHGVQCHAKNHALFLHQGSLEMPLVLAEIEMCQKQLGSNSCSEGPILAGSLLIFIFSILSLMNNFMT